MTIENEYQQKQKGGKYDEIMYEQKNNALFLGENKA